MSQSLSRLSTLVKSGKSLQRPDTIGSSKLTGNSTAEAMTETKQTPSSARRSPSPPAKKTRVDDEPNKKVLEQPQSKTPSQDLQTALALNKSETRIGEQLPVETNPAESNTSDTVEATSQSTQPGRPTMPILPPMLSPLSSVVEAEICKLTAAARDNEIGSEKSQSSVNSPSVTPTKSSNNDPKTVSKTGKTSNVEKVVTVAKLSKSTVPTKGPQEQRQTPSAISKGTKDIQSKAVHTPKAAPNEQFNNGKLVPTSTPKTTPPDVQKKIRLRVGLKIKKKANRKNLGNYLSLKPTPGRNSLFPNRQAEQVHRPTSSQTSAKHDSNERDARTAKKVDPKPSQSKDPKTGEKRGRPQIEESDIEPPSKRKLAGRLPQMQKPSTPTSVGTSSPVVSHLGSAHKPTSTPSTQAHGAAMLRGASGQGSVDTPQQSVATGTPAAPTTGRRRRSYTSPNKPKSPNLRHESQPYQEMARVLKHAADVYLKNWDQVNETERKRGVVLGTESVLSFMLAFVLLDTGLSYSDRNSWNSIIPFLSSLQNFSQQLADPTHMSGLLYQIEALIRDQISYADLQKLDRNPLQPEHGDVDVNVDKVQGQHNAAEYHKQFQAFHTHVMRAQSAWRSGWMKLDNDALSSQYPGTWGRRAEHRYAYGKGRDAVKKGEYSRNYNLPLNNMTSGLEGVNFGMNFLAEWSKANGVEWEPKLVL